MSDEPDRLRPWVKWYLTDQPTGRLIPEHWDVKSSVKLPDTITVPTVNITYKRITPNPVAPNSGSLVNEVIVRVADPHSAAVDFERAENDLDDEVEALFAALYGSDRLVVKEAEKVQIDGTVYLAWDITVEVLTTITVPAEPIPPTEE